MEYSSSSEERPVGDIKKGGAEIQVEDHNSDSSNNPQYDPNGSGKKGLLSQWPWPQFLHDPWAQVLLVSFVCFCCPGMYNAISGMGAGGLVDPTVASNATVALLSTGAISGVFMAGFFYDMLGPNLCMLIGGWTYALYSGALLNYKHHENAAFVIAAGALLGIGASFLWLPQGVIITTYISQESHKGRAIAIFWIIFNLGGGIGSLVSLGLNYHSKASAVSDSTFVAFMVIMLFGWVLGSVFLCGSNKLSGRYTGERVSKVKRSYKDFSLSKITATVKFGFSTLLDWKFAVLLPMFFYANIFYSYQQNNVNGLTFNIRSRALNSALYWMAQMFGGFLMGSLLDGIKWERKHRAMLGWAVLFVTGMVIWGGGYKFQIWNNQRIAEGHVQDLDFTERAAVGPIFLYIFYGMYDALWQSFCYWMIGAKSNSPAVSGVLVGSYKTCQCVGGAMAWRINALKVPAVRQLAMNWGLTGATLLIAIPAVWSVTPTNYDEQEAGQSTKTKEDKAEYA